VLTNLTEGLLDADCQVTVVVSGVDSCETTETIRRSWGKAEGRLVKIARYGTVNSQPITPDLVSVLIREISRFKPDIVHLHLPNPLAAAAWLAVEVLLGPGAPPVAVWYHADITRQKLGRLVVHPLTTSCLNTAVGICTSSEELVNNSPVLGDFKNKTTTIPFGINPEPWCQLSATGDGPFLFIGRLVRYKGLFHLLEAIARVKHASLVIIGDGPLAEGLQEKIGLLGLTDRVKLLGEVDEETLLKYMTDARALVLPSLDQSETFGLVQLEAMASAVPVVVSDLESGVRSVGQDQQTGLLVKPGDVDSLAAALTLLQDDPTQARQMGEGGRIRFNQEYTREIMVNRLLDWYKTLIEE